MLDAITQQRLEVSTDGGAAPYIMLPLAQVRSVQALLDSAKVAYWLDENAIAVDDEPAVTVINLRRGVDVEAIQALLDAV